MLGKKINSKLDEQEVIDILINWTDTRGNPDLRHFTNLLVHPIDFDDMGGYSGYLLKKNVLRQDIGLKKDSKPGDFDVLLIPCRDSIPLFDKTAAFEVKVVRPSRSNPSRNSNSLGTTQVNGLITDGFPFVGLIHVCLTEPLLDSEKLKIQVVKNPINIDNPSANKLAFEDHFWSLYDQFGNWSADKQMDRIIRMGLPKFVCLNCLSLEKYDNGYTTLGSCSQKFWNYQKGYFNPQVKAETIEKISSYVINNVKSFTYRTWRS